MLASCAAEPVGLLEDVETSCEAEVVPTESAPSPPLDVVIAIADTLPMAAHAERLRDELVYVARVLETIEGALPSVHVAVVGDDRGAFWAPDGCLEPGSDHLIDVEEPWFVCDDAACRDRNYAGDFADAVSCLGTIVAEAEAAPPMLDRVLRAVQADDTFLRDNAYLAILIITNHDDASPGSPLDYVAALRALKPDDSLVALGVVAPLDAPRLDAALQALPNRNARAVFDQQDWVDALPLVSSFGCGVTSGCVENPVGCISDVPPCEMATPDRPAADTPLPCWWIRDVDDDLYGCPYQAVVERASPGNAPATLRCPC